MIADIDPTKLYPYGFAVWGSNMLIFSATTYYETKTNILIGVTPQEWLEANYVEQPIGQAPVVLPYSPVDLMPSVIAAQVTFVLPPGVYTVEENFCQSLIAYQAPSGQMVLVSSDDSCVVSLKDKNNKTANATVSVTHPLSTLTAVYWNCISASASTFKCNQSYGWSLIRTVQQQEYSNMTTLSATRQWAASSSATSTPPETYKTIITWIALVLVVSLIIVIVIICWITRKRSKAMTREW